MQEVEWEIREMQEQGGPCPFHERFLQVLWNEHHLKTDLCCTDGTPLRILFSGLWNSGDGPDFSDARLILGGRVCCGGVEIHRNASDWKRHGHHRDPKYRSVILHVVWNLDVPASSFEFPALLLPHALLPDWQKLLELLEGTVYAPFRQIAPGKCAFRWLATEDGTLRELLLTAGQIRFAEQSGRLEKQAAVHGAEQVLYGAIFESLGYQRNRIPFRMLSERLPIRQWTKFPTALARRATYFGMAGMLPDSTRESVLPIWRTEIPEYWEAWWQSSMHSIPLPWSRVASRPYNSPWRRLTAGLILLERSNGHPASWIRKQFRQTWKRGRETSVSGWIRWFLKLLQVKDGRSEGCLDFSRKASPPASLLGRSRQLDLLANVLLPFLALPDPVCSEEENQIRGQLSRTIWLALPLGGDNRRYREAALRYFQPPSRRKVLLKHYSQQQGLLHIYRNFCQALGHCCEKCPLCRLEEAKV